MAETPMPPERSEAPGRSRPSRRTRRRLIRHALIRPTVSAALLFTLYFTLPLNSDFGATTLIALVAGLIVVAGLVAMQVHAISRSEHPRLTAITSFAVTVPLFVLSFAAVYYLMQRSTPDSFAAPMTRLDALYFTTTVLTTVGFGDIAARSELARGVVTVQMFADLVLVGLVVRVLFNAVGSGLGRRTNRAADGPADRGDE